MDSPASTALKLMKELDEIHDNGKPLDAKLWSRYEREIHTTLQVVPLRWTLRQKARKRAIYKALGNLGFVPYTFGAVFFRKTMEQISGGRLRFVPRGTDSQAQDFNATSSTAN